MKVEVMSSVEVSEAIQQDSVYFARQTADYYQKKWNQTRKDYNGLRIFALTDSGQVICDRKIASRNTGSIRFDRGDVTEQIGRFRLSLEQSGYTVKGLAFCYVVTFEGVQIGLVNAAIAGEGYNGEATTVIAAYTFKDGYRAFPLENISSDVEAEMWDYNNNFVGPITGCPSETVEEMLNAWVENRNASRPQSQVERHREEVIRTVRDHGGAVMTGLSEAELNEILTQFGAEYTIAHKKEKDGTFWVRIALKRWRKPHNTENMLRGEDHPLAVLTEEIVREARELYVPHNRDYSIAALADYYNVNYHTLRAAVQGSTWRHVN